MSKTPEHYVNNQEFFDALVAYRDECTKATQKGRKSPQIPDFIGECFLKIATHLSYKPNFVNYTFREDMISDGVENCLVYMHNFNPDKSKNPFGYFTSVIFYAFVRRIQRERKHTYLRYKLIEQAVIEGDTQTTHAGGGQYHVDSAMLSFDNVQDFIQRFDDYTDRRRARRRTAKTGDIE
jgi:hypothetical protein